MANFIKLILGSATVIVSIILIIGVIFLGIYNERTICINKWKDSGFASEFSISVGCMVNLKDGRKVPSDSVKFSTEEKGTK